MRFLVTGHRGFVGRHLFSRLQEDGHSVCGTEHLQSYVKTLSHATFDVTVHLAANIVNVDARAKQGVQAFRDTILDYTFCEYVERHPPLKAAIFLSSCAVDFPDDPYGMVKIMLEQYTKKLAVKVPVVVLRPFSGYGADQTVEYPFPAILQRAIDRQNPLIVWGGHQIRDWLYIDDLIDAILYSIDHFPKDARPIDIGTGVGTDFFSLARSLAGAVGYAPFIEGDSTKATASPARIAKSGVTAAAYGWRSKVSLEAGISRVLGLKGVSTPAIIP